ncbi:hypothetical protein SAMN05446037_101370 [Anaerovirgula multivorans]|uniref:Uncharacterized protein n=1 Tax=Anaerovirgula multivorans TaxID=312168 RepID=A0A239FLR3_9FIRM|nr:hypothetical protein [Anaerovirgula multivorans]SNS57538.1 hypothetical protein SAMN05446037_101370 [Anaerovirgula multivorans]
MGKYKMKIALGLLALLIQVSIIYSAYAVLDATPTYLAIESDIYLSPTSDITYIQESLFLPEKLMGEEDVKVIEGNENKSSLENEENGATIDEGSSQEGQHKPEKEIIEKPIEGPTKQTDNSLSQHLNPYVLEIIKTYKIGNGRYPYLLNDDYDNYNGVTTTLYYQNQVLLKAHPSGNRASHCSGITFEVFYKAMQARNKHFGIASDDFNGMTWDELFDFVLHWYASLGPKSQSNIAVAVEKYGVGKKIARLEDARAGDFIDISRENNTGHTAVFLEWIKEGDKIIGLKYWSSQGSTKGIDYHQEYFNIPSPSGKKYGNVMIDKVYIARVAPINQYKPFR